jgi:DUF971 family protein
MNETIPTGITANRATREVTLTWSDGHQSVYGFALLRNACPCAECRGGHAQMRSDPDPAVFDLPEEDSPASRLRDLRRVGQYGLTPIWEDGHEYGIYNWGYLRKLCPCPVCRAET